MSLIEKTAATVETPSAMKTISQKDFAIKLENL